MDMNGHMDMTISSISTKAPFQPDRLHIQWRAKNLWPRSTLVWAAEIHPVHHHRHHHSQQPNWMVLDGESQVLRNLEKYI
jgi:hypothetical protein